MLPSALRSTCSRPCSRSLQKSLRRSYAKHATDNENYRILTAIILNRSPVVTRPETPLESGFYDYQSRLRRALHNPFPNEFYFKPGSLLEGKFEAEERARERKAFGPGFGKASEDASSLMKIESNEKEETPMPRFTKADEEHDIQSLDRQYHRNLYLLLKARHGDKLEWRFPQGGVKEGEPLHEAAKRDLHERCGSKMNAWVVGRRPIGFMEYEGLDPSDAGKLNKMFFFKAHIFAGQAAIDNQDTTDFAWLTKREIESRVSEKYWEETKDLLSDY